jgi:hypothetical protein
MTFFGGKTKARAYGLFAAQRRENNRVSEAFYDQLDRLRSTVQELLAEEKSESERLRKTLEQLRQSALDAGLTEVEVCAGCGTPYEGRDCGCPCGSAKKLVNTRADRLREALERLREYDAAEYGWDPTTERYEEQVHGEVDTALAQGAAEVPAHPDKERPASDGMKLIDLTREWLREHGYDGLFNYDACACLLDDLMPCDDPRPTCRAGYKTPCTCGEGCEFHVSKEKPE